MPLLLPLRALLALGRVPLGLRGAPSRAPLRLDPAVIHRVLWVRPDAIGDAVLAADQLRLLRAALPEAELWALCAPALAPFYEASPLGLRTLVFERLPFRKSGAYRWALRRRLREARFDLALASPFTRDTVIDALALATRAPLRVAWASGSSASWKIRDADSAYTHLVPEPSPRELDRNRGFAAFLGLDVSNYGPRCWPSAADHAWAEAKLRELSLDPARLIIAFAGVQRPERRYGRYGEALALAFPAGEAQVLTVGLAGDEAANAQLRSAYPGPTRDLTGGTTLLQTAALLAKARLAFGGETGTAHLAWAMGTPQAVLLGGGHFGRFLPASPLTTIAALPLDCYGCEWRCRFERVHCVADVPPEALAKALRLAWEGATSRGVAATAISWTGSPGLADPPALPDLIWS